jgi:peptidoglycan/xylan/chitin deacetylase (PgdA/CDA1 family)
VTQPIVLTYHSHNVSGTGYAENDHVALASDLRSLTRLGVRIVPLGEIADALDAGRVDGSGERIAAITFDDGPSFDFADFVHREFGSQRGFLGILRDFRDESPGAQPGLHATSFVIASPQARRAMERAEDCGYTWLDDWLTDRWWGEAADSGLLAIGNHSWDHVHPAVESVVTASQERGDFTRVDSYPDADREIRAAGAFINARVGGRCDMFAYPFGHVNDYLARDYFPHRGYEHGMRAAFGTGGRGVRPGDSAWDIPRAVCGHHWKSPDELESLLGS